MPWVQPYPNPIPDLLLHLWLCSGLCHPESGWH